MGLIAESLLRGTILLVAAFGAQAALRRWPARPRDTLWFVAMTSLFIVPWFVVLGTGVRVPVFAARAIAPITAPVFSPAEFAPEPAGEVPIAGATPANAAGLSATSLVAGVWVTGALLCVFALIRSVLRARAIRRRATTHLPATMVLAARRARERVGMRSEVPIHLSQDVAVPMTGGVRRPFILLPAAARNWDASCLDIVLTHELIHVQRHDAARLLMERLGAAAWWFHPLAWLGLRAAIDAREQACDEAVVGRGIRLSEYARALLEVAGDVPRSPATALVGFGPPLLANRIRRLMEPRRSHRSGALVSRSTAFIAAMVVVVDPAHRAGPPAPVDGTNPGSGVTAAALDSIRERPLPGSLPSTGASDPVRDHRGRSDSGASLQAALQGGVPTPPRPLDPAPRPPAQIPQRPARHPSGTRAQDGSPDCDALASAYLPADRPPVRRLFQNIVGEYAICVLTMTSPTGVPIVEVLGVQGAGTRQAMVSWRDGPDHRLTFLKGDRQVPADSASMEWRQALLDLATESRAETRAASEVIRAEGELVRAEGARTRLSADRLRSEAAGRRRSAGQGPLREEPDPMFTQRLAAADSTIAYLRDRFLTMSRERDAAMPALIQRRAQAEGRVLRAIAAVGR